MPHEAGMRIRLRSAVLFLENTTHSARAPASMRLIGERTLFESQLNFLKRYGITDLHLILDGDGYDSLRVQFGCSGAEFEMDLRYYSRKEGFLRKLKKNLKEEFLFFPADLLFDVELSRLMNFHMERKPLATVLVQAGKPDPAQTVRLDPEKRVVTVHERRDAGCGGLPGPALVPLYLLSPEIFKNFVAEEDFNPFCLARSLAGKSRRIYGYKTAEYVREIKGVRDRDEATLDMLSGKVQRFSKRHKRPAIFIDADGTLIEDPATGGARLLSFAAPALKMVNESDFLIFLVSNKDVLDKKIRSLQGILRLNEEVEDLLAAEGVYLDHIYFCLHNQVKNPALEPFAGTCGCAPPEPGLIRKACEEFNIDIESSWMIGDSSVDIELGLRGGLRTVLVRTGLAGRDRRFDAVPEFVFNDMGDAVKFILRDRYNYLFFADQVIDELKSRTGDSPVVVRVSGPSISGKKAFVRILATSMLREGIPSDVLSLQLENEEGGSFSPRRADIVLEI